FMIIIVLSDFRIHMLAAAFSIGKRLEKNNKVCYVSSKAFLIKNDYGNNFLNKLSRIIAKHILRLHKVIILPFTKYPAESNDLTGVFSSLYSLTSDSTADKEKYPKIWDDLLEIDAAS